MTLPRFGTAATLLLALVACRATVQEEGADGANGADGADGSAEWEELGGDGTDGTGNDGESKDTGKDGYQACGSEVAAGAPCEGSWEETLCVDDSGTFWWCEGGSWTSDKDR